MTFRAPRALVQVVRVLGDDALYEPPRLQLREDAVDAVGRRGEVQQLGAVVVEKFRGVRLVKDGGEYLLGETP